MLSRGGRAGSKRPSAVNGRPVEVVAVDRLTVEEAPQPQKRTPSAHASQYTRHIVRTVLAGAPYLAAEVR